MAHENPQSEHKPGLEISREEGTQKTTGKAGRFLVVIGLTALAFGLVAAATVSLFPGGSPAKSEPTTEDGKLQQENLRSKRREDERNLADMKDRLLEEPGTERTSLAKSLIREFESLYEQEKRKEAEEKASSFDDNLKSYRSFEFSLPEPAPRPTVESTPGDIPMNNTPMVESLPKEVEKKSMWVLKPRQKDERGDHADELREILSHLPTGEGNTGSGPKTPKIVLTTNDRFPQVTIYEGDFLEGILSNEISTDVEEGPVIAYTSRDFFDDSGVYVVIPYGTRVIGKSRAVNYKGQGRLYIWFHRLLLPAVAGDERVSIDLPVPASALDRRGVHGVVSKVNRHFWMQYGSAALFGVMDGLTGLARNRMSGNSLSVLVDGTGQNISGVNSNRLGQYQNIIPTVKVKAGTRIKIYLACDIKISAYDLKRNRPYARKQK